MDARWTCPPSPRRRPARVAPRKDFIAFGSNSAADHCTRCQPGDARAAPARSPLRSRVWSAIPDGVTADVRVQLVQHEMFPQRAEVGWPERGGAPVVAHESRVEGIHLGGRHNLGPPAFGIRADDVHRERRFEHGQVVGDGGSAGLAGPREPRASNMPPLCAISSSNRRRNALRRPAGTVSRMSRAQKASAHASVARLTGQRRAGRPARTRAAPPAASAA